MWNLLQRTDLDQAQRELISRRAEILRRHAEELARLEADESDLEALDRLASAFSTKFKKTAPAIPAIAVTKKADRPVTQHRQNGDRPHPRAPHSDRRGLSGTNFEVFSRALSKSAF
jgi:hypothetical protein